MKKKMKYILPVLLMALLVAFALLAPQTADRWYDRQTLGQLSYEKIDYEPYNISLYHSFADKIDAIASAMEQGVAPYTVKLKERQDAPTDQELEEKINAELKTLYEEKILPQEMTIEKLRERGLYQVYVVPAENGSELLQDVCFWNIEADTEYGKITLAMDNTFYKIYGVYVTDPSQDVSGSVEAWMVEQMKDSCAFMTEAWCIYWGIEGYEMYGEETDSTVVTENSTKTDNTASNWGYGTESDYMIVSASGHSFYVWNWLENPLMYGKPGERIWVTGLGEILSCM